jgi:C-8 sterol isomerase
MTEGVPMMSRNKFIVAAAALFGILLLAALCGCDYEDDSVSGFSGEETAGNTALSPLTGQEADIPFAQDPATKTSFFKLYYWLQEKMGDGEDRAGQFEFTPEELMDVARLGIGLPIEEAVHVMHEELKARHPGKLAENLRWTFNSAGTAFCQIAIAFASTNEYVAFFGTPIGAEGFSGRYKADVWDLMFDGEMWTYVPGQFDKDVYLAGDLAYLPRDGGKGVRYVDHAWMIDYGRGNVLSMFPFGVIAPAMFYTLDWQSAWEQLVDFAKIAIRNMF